MHDLEEVIAAYYPYLEVGKRSGYNGVGYALAGKIIEAVSGETVPQYFHNHLWEPLGCNNTETADMSARGFSAPWDMAVLGQMLLNRGAYGNLRFFFEETFQKLLPVKLAPYVDYETDAEWGIGAVWMRDPGLGPNTFAHGAASAATLRIDPEHDLVIVMTRNTAGPEWGKYHPQFIQAIVENLAE
jgi:CubicO group peptidase (beta-lactamase class C family)